MQKDQTHTQMRGLLIVFSLFLVAGIGFFLRYRSYTPLLKTENIEIFYRGTNVSSQYLALISHGDQSSRILFIQNPESGFTKVFTIDTAAAKIMDYYTPNYRLPSIPLFHIYAIHLDQNTDKLDLEKDLKGYFPDFQFNLIQDAGRLEFNLPVTTHGWYKEFDTIMIHKK